MSNQVPHLQSIPLTRRSLGMLVAGGLALVGCAPDPTPAQAPSIPAFTPTASPGASTRRTPTTSTPAPPAPSASSSLPDEVATRFAGASPTEWGTEVAGVVSTLRQSHNSDGQPRVALTLDACGGKSGSGFDESLVQGLVDRSIPATLFVNLRWMQANPGITAELATIDSFELGNHGTRHVPLSVTGRDAYGISGSASAREAVDEVWGCHEHLAELLGEAPRLFRSGTAHYDEIAVQIVEALGETVIGFATNGDGGATFSAATVRREVTSTAPGGIVIAHFNQPTSGTAEGLLAAVDDMLEAGAEFTLLDQY